MIASRPAGPALAVLLVVLAGCSGLPGAGGGGGDLTFSAEPVTVADTAVAESGFRVASEQSFSFERSFEVAGQSRTVAVNAHFVHLQRDYDGVPAHIAVMAVPDIELLGQQLSVAKQVGPLSLVDRASSSMGDLKREQKLREREVAILGKPRTVEVYRGSARRGDRSAPVLVLITSFSVGGDTVVAVGVTPRVDANATAPVIEAFAGIRRP